MAKSLKSKTAEQNLRDTIEKLENGVKGVFDSERYKEYLGVMSKFHTYSARNCMLIMMQCPEATLVAGYRKWQSDFGRYVKKGEKAIRILAPIPHKLRKEVELPDGTKEERELHWNSFRTVSVFDVSQTDGKELPTLADELDGNVEKFAEVEAKLVKAAPVPVCYDEVEGEALGFYHSKYGIIVVQEGMSETQTLKTLIHEIAHSILHSPEGEEKEAGRSKREVQAESVAYVVCESLGLDTSDYSFAYIATWSSGKETSELLESLEVIRRTSAEIIDAIAA